jgi:hypothetical protein
MDTIPFDGSSLAFRGERTAFLNREAAEVYLLLDFLSGRADRSMRPTEEERLRCLVDRHDRNGGAGADADEQRTEIETDLCDPTRLILRTMRIKYPIEPADQRFQADAAFLMRARDVLNTRAAPATGLTVAFTSMVAGQSHDGQDGAEGIAQFAERAYPQYRHLAHELARSVTWMLRSLLVFLALALAVSAYAAWGKVMLDTLDAVRRDDGATQQAVNAVQPGSALASPASICADQKNSQSLPCIHAADIKERYAVTSYQLAAWEWPLGGRPIITDEESHDPRKQKIAEQLATPAMTVLGNYLMPVLFGLLGSIAYVLRRHYDRLGKNLLSPSDLRSNSIRLTLGVMIGGSIGLVFSSSSVAQATGVLGAAATLSTAGFAFLAGYGVEAVFKLLDTIITQVFHVNGTEPAVRPKPTA